MRSSRRARARTDAAHGGAGERPREELAPAVQEHLHLVEREVEHAGDVAVAPGPRSRAARRPSSPATGSATSASWTATLRLRALDHAASKSGSGSTGSRSVPSESDGVELGRLGPAAALAPAQRVEAEVGEDAVHVGREVAGGLVAGGVAEELDEELLRRGPRPCGGCGRCASSTGRPRPDGGRGATVNASTSPCPARTSRSSSESGRRGAGPGSTSLMETPGDQDGRGRVARSGEAAGGPPRPIGRAAVRPGPSERGADRPRGETGPCGPNRAPRGAPPAPRGVSSAPRPSPVEPQP